MASFLEGIAERGPLVLVFEDLHWADEHLLDFLEHLVDWASDVPTLVVGSTRPEFFERRPGWGGGKRNSITVRCRRSPARKRLADRGPAEGPVIPAETQSGLLERAGGNPLYAEEYVRMLGKLPGGDATAGARERPGHHRGSARHASARTGKRCCRTGPWSARSSGPGPSEIATAPGSSERLHRLERKQFIVRERRSTVAGEDEFAFPHVLVREVAYGQIPRADRAAKHRRVAEWIDALGRREDDAEMLAHHYSTALDLARAAGDVDPVLEAQTRSALREAGDRALGRTRTWRRPSSTAEHRALRLATTRSAHSSSPSTAERWSTARLVG